MQGTVTINGNFEIAPSINPSAKFIAKSDLYSNNPPRRDLIHLRSWEILNSPEYNQVDSIKSIPSSFYNTYEQINELSIVEHFSCYDNLWKSGSHKAINRYTRFRESVSKSGKVENWYIFQQVNTSHRCNEITSDNEWFFFRFQAIWFHFDSIQRDEKL